jgi:hypothetical protein
MPSFGPGWLTALGEALSDQEVVCGVIIVGGLLLKQLKPITLGSPGFCQPLTVRLQWLHLAWFWYFY